MVRNVVLTTIANKPFDLLKICSKWKNKMVIMPQYVGNFS